MNNPWKGLACYEENDLGQYKFCGRDKSIRELSMLIKNNLFITLYGRTGIGKTSLLKAGVFPLLRAERYIPIIVRFNEIEEENPLPFADYIISKIEETVPVVKVNDYSKATDSERDLLWEYFATRHFYDNDGREVFPTIVLDQFEENFLRKGKKGKAWQLLEQLYSLTDDNKAFPEGYHNETNFRIVISIREDDLFRLEDCIDTLGLSEFKYNRYRLVQLTDKEAGDIICLPGNEVLPADGSERSEIVKSIIDLVRSGNDNDNNLSTLMLSLVCSRLFERAQTSGGVITQKLVEGMGTDLLHEFYASVISNISDAGQRYYIEDNLVDAHGRRNSINKEIVVENCPEWEVLTEGSNRILQESNGKIELVHDMLAVAVYEAREKRHEAERMAALEKEKEEMRKKNRRKMIGMAFVILFFAGIGTMFAYQYSKIAEGQKALKTAYADLESKNTQLERQKQDLESANEQIRKATGLVEQKNDSLQQTYADLASKNTELERKTQDLLSANHLIQQKSEALTESMHRMRENQARASATKAQELIDQGKYYEAALVALEILPEDLENPGEKVFTIEAEGLLRTALNHNRCNVILVGHTDDVDAVAFSPDGKRIVSGSDDKTIRIWDAETHKQIGEPLVGHIGSVESIAFSPDGKSIVSGSRDHTIRVWDAETHKQIGEPFVGHSELVYPVAFSPDGKRIASGSFDTTIRIWDADTHKQIGEPLEGHTKKISSIAFSPDGKRIVSGSHDNTIRIWDVETHKQIGESLVGYTSVAFSVAFSPDGKRIVSGSEDFTIRIWDADTHKQIGEPLIGHTHFVSSVAFSPDGKSIVSGSLDKTIRIWDAETHKQIGDPLVGHTDFVSSVAFSHDGKKIVSGSGDNSIRIWDTDIYIPFEEPLVGQFDCVESIVFSPDRKKIVSGSDDKTIRIWDAETLKQIGEPLVGHSSYVESVAFSPDGKRIVSGAWDDTIRIWDAETHKQIGEPLVGHIGTVESVAFSPDGKRIVSGSGDYTIRIWDAETHKQIGEPLVGDLIFVTSVAFSPDGKRIVSRFADNTRIWEWKPLQELIDEARKKFKGQTLTPLEKWTYYLE